MSNVLEVQRNAIIREISEQLRFLETRPISDEVLRTLLLIKGCATQGVDLHKAKYPLEVSECKSSVIPRYLLPPLPYDALMDDDP